jgi:hypothetical protein
MVNKYFANRANFGRKEVVHATSNRNINCLLNKC